MRYKPKFDPLRALLLEVSAQRSVPRVLDLITTRLTRTSQVALCRIWLARPVCPACDSESPGADRCLHLAASAGRSTADKDRIWDTLDGDHARIPFGEGKIGEIAASASPLEIEQVSGETHWMMGDGWADREGIRGFGGEPLTVDGRVIGVLAVCTRMPLEEEWLTWLRMIADHAAVAIENARAFDELTAEQLPDQSSESKDLLGDSPAFTRTRRQIDLAAAADAAVLIDGELGTGKSRIARKIHARGPRRDRPFVTVDCTHAETSNFSPFPAPSRASGGTLFLEAVDRVPLDAQSALLSALEQAADVRVIASTDRDLSTKVRDGRFREDLYFFLNVVSLSVPSLRDRKDDIPALADRFIADFAHRLGRPAPALPEPAIRRLVAYAWPGNVRELRNVIERAVLTSTGDTLRVDLVSLAAPTAHLAAGSVPVANDGILTEDEMVEMQERNLRAALDRTGWKIYGPGGTAELLGLRPTTLASRIKKFELKQGD